jgi:DNA-binding phage protein
MSKFTHAGVSKQNGEFKVRFCNDAMRVKVLAKNGHKDIDIIELKEAMTKEDAVAYLLSINFDNGNKSVRAALEAAADKRGVTVVAAKKEQKPTKEAKKPKAPAKPKAEAVVEVEAPAVMTPTVSVAALEDAPF